MVVIVVMVVMVEVVVEVTVTVVILEVVVEVMVMVVMMVPVVEVMVMWVEALTTTLQEFDPVRTGRFFIMGTCVVAPCIRTWYLFMERVVKFQGRSSSLCGLGKSNLRIA